MAPSSQYNRRQFGNGGNGGENINPQQNNNNNNYNAYASLTRLAKYTTTTTTTNSNSNTTTNNNNNSVESAAERRPTVKITNTRVQGKQQPSAASGFQRKQTGGLFRYTLLLLLICVHYTYLSIQSTVCMRSYRTLFFDGCGC